MGACCQPPAPVHPDPHHHRKRVGVMPRMQGSYKGRHDAQSNNTLTLWGSSCCSKRNCGVRRGGVCSGYALPDISSCSSLSSLAYANKTSTLPRISTREKGCCIRAVKGTRSVECNNEGVATLHGMYTSSAENCPKGTPETHRGCCK